MNKTLATLVLLLVVGSSQSQTVLQPGEFTQVDLRHTHPVTYQLDIAAEDWQTYLLNIEWYPLASPEHQGVQHKSIPVPEIKVRKDGQGWKDLSAELPLFDLNMWVVRLPAGRYLVELRSPVDTQAFAVKLSCSLPDTLNLHMNQTVVANVKETADRFRVTVDMKNNSLEYRDAFAIEMWVCKGKFLDFEVQYVKSGLSLEKVRKSEFPAYHGPRGYLIAHDVRKDAKEYVFDFFKKQSKVAHRGDVIVKLRLLRLPRNAKPNLASLHQALGNEEYPGGLKLASKSKEESIEISVKPDEYLFQASGLESPLVYGYITSGPTQDLLFRKQCGFDKSIIFGSNSSTVGQVVQVPSQVTRPRHPIKGSSVFGRLVIADQQRVYTTDSGVIDLHTGVIMTNSNGPGTGDRQQTQPERMEDGAHVDHAYAPNHHGASLTSDWWLFCIGALLLIMSIWAIIKLRRTSGRQRSRPAKVSIKIPEVDPEELQTISKDTLEGEEGKTKRREIKATTAAD